MAFTRGIYEAVDTSMHTALARSTGYYRLETEGDDAMEIEPLFFTLLVTVLEYSSLLLSVVPMGSFVKFDLISSCIYPLHVRALKSSE